MSVNLQQITNIQNINNFWYNYLNYDIAENTEEKNISKYFSKYKFLLVG